jgi:hypothetical protein
MIRLTRWTGIALSAACLLTQAAVFADEERSSSAQTTTPAGTASTSVHSSANGAGTATTVRNATSTPGQTKTRTYRASAGPNGAKVSQTKTNVQGNANGSISSTREHESHAIGNAGSAHHVSKSSTTVSPDGSSSSQNQDARTNNP